MGWYLDKTFTKQFDFETTAVNRNLTLYARWLDYLCTTDTDSDGIVDSLEEYIGSDVNGTDTDGDGLSDYEELYEIGTNPLVKDTDGNGVEDFVDDLDEDGLSNGEEIRYNTNACHDDTDIDDLTDYDEINIYHTDPTLNDTDSDGAPDGWEIANGYDPLVHDNRYTLTESSGTISEANPVVAKVTLDAYDADVYSLEIRKVKYHDNPFISPSIAGYLGDAYEFTFDGKFDTAEMVFEYDVNLGELSDTFQPRIYYFNEETNAFEELENQTVENGRVTVTTTHFSTYILLNKVEFDEVWNTEIKTAADGAGLNIAFVVDLSGSMYGTKLTTTKTAINSFIDVLDDTDKAALISFTNDAVLRCDMTNDKEVLKSAVNGMRADGLTSIYRGIGKAMDVFETSDLNGYKMMVVFTDGYDEPSTTYEGYYKNLVERAGKAGVTIYSVGISTIDEALLTRVAESTGGKYYYASVVSELKEKVEEVKEEIIDYNSDSNDDGITDYHTKLIMEGKLLLKNSSDELKGINFNFDEKGEAGGTMSDDWDKDGIRNGDEIQVVSMGAWTYIEMKSHPLRQHSDSDGVDDYTEIQRGSDPLYYDVQKAVVDILCDESRYSFEPLATDLREDGFKKGLIGWSAIVNGVWNKKELYRDLIIDYYSTYVTSNVVDEAMLQKEKETWADVLVKMLDKAKDELDKAQKVSEATEDYREAYDIVKNINNFISYANGITDAKMMDANFVKKITDELMHLNEVSEEATEFRFDVDGMPYIKKYWDEGFVKKIVNGSTSVMNVVSLGFTVQSGVQDMRDTVYNLKKVEANKAVFADNMEVLEWLGLITTDKNIRAAADDVMKLLMEDYLEVYADAIDADTTELIGKLLLNFLANANGYVAVVVGVRDVMNALFGTEEDLKQMYRVLCYSDMCNIYSMVVPMQAEVSADGSYYYCREHRIHMFKKYIRHLAQLRILGEKEYYAYLKGEKGLPKLMDSIFGTEDVKSVIEMRINTVRKVAEVLDICLSDALEYELK